MFRRVEPQVGLLGAGADRVGDLVPAVPVESGVGHHLGQEPLGLVDEAPGEAPKPQVTSNMGCLSRESPRT